MSALLVWTMWLCRLLWKTPLLWPSVSIETLQCPCRCRLLIPRLMKCEVGGIIVLVTLVWAGPSTLLKRCRLLSVCSLWVPDYLVTDLCGLSTVRTALAYSTTLLGGVSCVLLFRWTLSISGALGRCLSLVTETLISLSLLAMISLMILLVTLQALVKQ